MRVMTMNLFGHHGGWDARRPLLRDALSDISPDVLAFQESVVTTDHDQVVELLGSAYEVVHQSGRSPDGVGASIASRWPMSVVLEANLSVPGHEESAGWLGSLAVVRIDAEPPTDPLLIGHYKPAWQPDLEHVREAQAVEAAGLIEEVSAASDEPVILLGDFDAAPDAASMRFWTGERTLRGVSVCYADAWDAVHPDDPGHTFTPDNDLVGADWRPDSGRRIDYILIRCDAQGAPLDVIDCRLAFDRPVEGVWASDHFGVVADLQAVEI